MGLVEEVLAPRLDTPRKKVAAGGVGTSLSRRTRRLPVVSPGAGADPDNTPAKRGDRHRDGYSLMRPGRPIRFEAVDHAEFINLGGDDTPLEGQA